MFGWGRFSSESWCSLVIKPCVVWKKFYFHENILVSSLLQNFCMQRLLRNKTESTLAILSNDCVTFTGISKGGQFLHELGLCRVQCISCTGHIKMWIYVRILTYSVHYTLALVVPDTLRCEHMFVSQHIQCTIH